MRARPAIWTGIAAVCAVLVGATALAGGRGAPAAPSGSLRTKEIKVGSDITDLVLLTTRKGTRTLVTGPLGTGMRPAPAGVVIPGTTQLVSTDHNASSTRLRVTDFKTGEGSAPARFTGDLAATVVSGSGRFAALTPPRAPGATPWMPDGRRETRIVIAPVDGAERARSFSLDGNFEPEAFSTDDRTLFLIEYMPALAPSHYAVRRMNLATGRVAPIARLKLAAPRVMRGTGRMQVLSPDRTKLHTLYTQQGPNYAHGAPRDHDSEAVHAFVHVLSLEERWAHCIDLPAPFGTGEATATALAATPDGRRLYVSDWTNGAIATIDPDSLQVLRVTDIDLGGADDQTFAAAGNRVVYVAGDSAVVALDANTMTEIARWKAPGKVKGLALAPSGDALYVAAGPSVVLLDRTLHSRVKTWRAPGVTGIVGAFAREEIQR